MVVAVAYLTWTDDGLLRHVTFQGVREDKPAAEVRRPRPGEA
jgi:bifunctional non-homologous end joining protein LigD